MIDLLAHAVCLEPPERLAPSAWTGHIPFAMFLVELVKPRVLVELGTYRGTSYCAFCQAVASAGIECRCCAVDNWTGDPHLGQYGSAVFDDLRAYHDARYSAFSTLRRSSFDEACATWPDATIDLLHIDGYHTYDAVRHDFESWLPKMAPCGLVLLHDIAERKGDFGVWQLWQELAPRYPHLAFAHSHGLGVLAVGTAPPAAFLRLAQLDEQKQSLLRRMFAHLGDRWTNQSELDALRRQVDAGVRSVEQQHAAQTAAIESAMRILSQLAEAHGRFAALLSGVQTAVATDDTRLGHPA